MNRTERLALLGMVLTAMLAAIANFLGLNVPPVPQPPVVIPPIVVPPEPKPPTYGELDPANSVVKIATGNAGCTACIVGPRRADGRWNILTAAHCVQTVGQRGNADLLNGRRYGYSVRVIDRQADLAWLVTEDVIDHLPYALLAESNPAPGTRVWHQGYGIDKPGNREDGWVEAAENGDGQIRFLLSVSSGDSGGPIFTEPGHLVGGSVCCTTARGQRATMYAGSPRRAARLLTSSVISEWEPLEIPMVMPKKD